MSSRLANAATTKRATRRPIAHQFLPLCARAGSQLSSLPRNCNYLLRSAEFGAHRTHHCYDTTTPFVRIQYWNGPDQIQFDTPPPERGWVADNRACCLYFTANRSYASPRVSRTVMNSHVCRAQGGPQLGTQRTHYTLACKVLSSTYPVLEAWCYQVLQEAQSRCRWATISTSSGRL